jgi:hypothetical protein
MRREGFADGIGFRGAVRVQIERAEGGDAATGALAGSIGRASRFLGADLQGVKRAE